jgi:predicted Zn-dependent protease
MIRMKTLALTTVALGLAFSAGAAGGQNSGNSRNSAQITPAEAQQGAQYHPQLLAEFGGTYTGPQAAYVETVGKNIAFQSGLANARSDFTVSLLNSPVNNAFAIPGGYIYSTRQLVALMNNEAELAAVLGHEVGHVAARHSQRRQSNAQKNTLIGGGLAILSSILLGDSQIGNTLSRGFMQGSQLLTLRFSRKQELQADNLGIDYLIKAGYDPRAMGTVLASLAAQNSLDAQLQGRDARMPEWASTHPDPAGRVQKALTRAGTGTGQTNADTFLTRIDGITYGDDPKQGVIEGSAFIHPDMRLTFTAPQGFYMVNGTRAVSINGQSGKAQLSLSPYNGNIEAYIRGVFKELGGEQQQLAPSSIERTTVNGIPAAVGQARVQNGRNQVDVIVFAYEFASDRAYHFTAMTQAGGGGVFTPMFNSMRRITANEAAQVVRRRIQVVTVRNGETVASLARRMAFDSAQEARFRVLNGLGSADTVRVGQKVKLVIKAS